LITEEQMTEALAETGQSGDLLGRVLLRRRWLFEDELVRALSEQLQIPSVNIRSSGVDHDAARMVSVEIGLRNAAIPIGFVSGRLRVAFADPCDETACAAIADPAASTSPRSPNSPTSSPPGRTSPARRPARPNERSTVKLGPVLCLPDALASEWPSSRRPVA
jgi:hypothetical protein